MGRLVAVEFVSLDGVMQSPGRPDEDTRSGFDRGGWANAWLQHDSEAAQAAMGDPGGTEAMLFGRRTYLDLVGHWLATTEPNPFTEVLAVTPKHVVSATLGEPLPHPNSHLLTGDPARSVRDLKQQVSGGIVLLGSGQLVRSLFAAGLVDGLVLTTVPVVLGQGARLLEGTPLDLEVERSWVSPTGVVVSTYAVSYPRTG